MYIVIDGNIGVGKSTLLNKLDQNKAISVQEPVQNNPFLQPMLSGKIHRDFHLMNQLFYLVNSTANLERAFQKSEKYGPSIIVQERGFQAIDLFTSNLVLDGKLKGSFFELSRRIQHSYPKIDVYCYLDASPNLLLDRIRKRNREGEEHYTLEYIKSLNAKYIHMLTYVYAVKTVVVNWSNFDDMSLPLEIRRLIKEKNYEQYR